ncbi:MAG: FIST C-terminal domain-containing protein [Thermostichus sp. HHBFW_bins_43]
MQWVNALSQLPSLEAALRQVVEEAKVKLQAAQLKSALTRQVQTVGSGSLPGVLTGYVSPQPPRPTLGILFVSGAFASEYIRVLPLLSDLLEVEVLIGCSGGGIVGGGHEIEDGPALSLSLAVMPDVVVHPFHVRSHQLPDLDAAPAAWIDLIGVSPQTKPHFLILADGFSSGVSELLQGLDFAYPGAVKVGGLASGGRGPNSNALFLLDARTPTPRREMHREGTVGLALYGNVMLEAVVAQGCRPIGIPLRVTEAEGNVILGLEGRAPLPLLQELAERLSPADQQLARHSLFIGLLMNEFKSEPTPGDFLIRVILGIDPRVGAMAIGDRVRPGQTVQFHLRDAQTSAEDLRWALSRYGAEHNLGQSRSQEQPPAARPDPCGALMFSCLGRGQGLYGTPNFDSQQFRELLGELPLGGFFCNGEIGPVGGSTFLHGYTSCFGIFRPAH